MAYGLVFSHKPLFVARRKKLAEKHVFHQKWVNHGEFNYGWLFWMQNASVDFKLLIASRY